MSRPLPEGRSLAPETWSRRHRVMMVLLWSQAAGLGMLGLAVRADISQTLTGAGLVGLSAAVGAMPRLTRKVRTGSVAFGLMAASALLVHLTQGLPQSHFHFFVMLAVIALYHDWFAFLVAVGTVMVHHTAAGLLDPDAVFVGQGGLAAPVEGALLHAAYVVAASAVSVVAWRLNERDRSHAEQLLNSTGNGVYGLDLEGRITFVNDATARMLGAGGDELVGRPDHDAMGHLALDGTRLGRAGCPVCAAVGTANGVPAREAAFSRADGSAFPVEYTSTPVRERERTTGTVVTFADLTEHAQLTERALHDHLTGLPNRTLVLERLGMAVTRMQRHRQLTAVLFLDLDRFKVVNDSLGHSAGDELLKAAARRLQRCVRTQDTVARFGGDEFVVLCEDVASEQDVIRIAERMVDAFTEPFVIGDAVVSASTSIGIKLTTDPQADPEALLRDADAAMYRAKESGRNRFELFDDEMRARAMERLQVESDLRLALTRGELVVHYQPKVALDTERITGVEALVRWQHPTRGLLAPADFIPIAEETGQIVPLGSWVLEEACRQVQHWRTTRPDCSRLLLAVNLSGRQLAQPDLVATVAGVLARTGMPARLLCLEITESVLMRNADAAAATLRELKRLGVTLAVDDFGTGYSSLSYLTRFPVDTLKVDRSFVLELDGDARSWSIVAAVLGLSQALGLTAVAEGVESGVQAVALRNLGCELAQGYHFARPQPAAAVEALFGAPARAPDALTSASRVPATS